MQTEDVLAQYQECTVCGMEMGEDGQEHSCECGEELTETECHEQGGFCGRCGWKNK